jgi:hypothetical protein
MVQLEHGNRAGQRFGLLLHGRCGRRACSTSAAFCCVTLSICDTAWLTCSMPALCSRVAR